MKVSSKYCVGYSYVNKQGLNVKVVEYRGRKDITVEFEIDGARKVTTGSYIKKLLPLHPTYGKFYVGQRFTTKDDVVEIVEVISQSELMVKWLSDGYIAKKKSVSLREGYLRHPIKNIPKVGEVYTTNSGKNLTVINYINATNVEVEFEDGLKITTTTTNLKDGNIRYPIDKEFVGKKFTTNSGWELTIIDYKSTNEVLVEWQDGSKTIESMGHIRDGGIKPPNQVSLFGVGYFGIGRFVNSRKKDGEKVEDKIYQYWERMIKRCYDPLSLNKVSGRAYRDVLVCKEWLCFQNFAEWAVLQVNSKDFSYELDKDLLFIGNKTYSPSTCCFIPMEINQFLSEGKEGTYYRGVNVIKPKTANAKIGYVARCNTGIDREYLGFYNTPEEAFLAYKTRKEEYAKELAEEWKGKIDDKAYFALLNYEVNI